MTDNAFDPSTPTTTINDDETQNEVSTTLDQSTQTTTINDYETQNDVPTTLDQSTPTTTINDDETQNDVPTTPTTWDAAQADIPSETSMTIPTCSYSMQSSPLPSLADPIPARSNGIQYSSDSPSSSAPKFTLSRKLIFSLLPTTLLVIAAALIFLLVKRRRRRQRNGDTSNDRILSGMGQCSRGDDGESASSSLAEFGFSKYHEGVGTKDPKPPSQVYRHHRTSTVLQFEAMHPHVVVVDVEGQNGDPRGGKIIITGNDGRNGDRRMIKVLKWSVQAVESGWEGEKAGPSIEKELTEPRRKLEWK